ncbi:MAG: hypothetical protein LKJ79_00900 [Mageeibacillus sp.]|jgi:hypothetical protein|nr:hypothetical protein [Mageeibacillus sp.]
MKKNADNIGNRSGTTQRVMRARKIPLAAWISAGVAVIMIGVLAILAIVSKTCDNCERKALCYGIDNYSAVSTSSLEYAMKSAGFDCVFVGSEGYADDKYVIPDEYSGDDVFIVAAGEASFSVAADIDSAKPSNVIGYCLIAPEYPGDDALDGWSMNYPDCDVAIFGFARKAGSLDEMSGAQMLFERLSGVDTVYGVPARTGGALSSEVFVSADQTRYLSLSHINSDVRKLISGASFQSELSGYLENEIGQKADYGRLNAFFVLRATAIFIALASILVFVYFVPVPVPDKGEKHLKGRDSLALIVFMGVSVWLALAAVVMSVIPYTLHFVRYLMVFSPVVLITGMFIARLGFYMSNKVTCVRRIEKSGVYIIMALLEVSFVVASLCVFTELDAIKKPLAVSGYALAVMLLDYTDTSCLAQIDKKSRCAGEGSGSYFGNPLYFVETLIPAAAGLAVSCVTGDSDLRMTAILGLLIAAVPYLASVTIKRNSDCFEIVGAVHAVIMGLLVYIAF